MLRWTRIRWRGLQRNRKWADRLFPMRDCSKTVIQSRIVIGGFLRLDMGNDTVSRATTTYGSQALRLQNKKI